MSFLAQQKPSCLSFLFDNRRVLFTVHILGSSPSTDRTSAYHIQFAKGSNLIVSTTDTNSSQVMLCTHIALPRASWLVGHRPQQTSFMQHWRDKPCHDVLSRCSIQVCDFLTVSRLLAERQHTLFFPYFGRAFFPSAAIGGNNCIFPYGHRCSVYIIPEPHNKVFMIYRKLCGCHMCFSQFPLYRRDS